MVKTLLEHGHAPISLGSVIKGYRDAVPDGEAVIADLADRVSLKAIFFENVTSML
jgi:hypothetical protein